MKGVSAWNFDLAALKAEAEKESEPELPSIPETHVASAHTLPSTPPAGKLLGFAPALLQRPCNL